MQNKFLPLQKFILIMDTSFFIIGCCNVVIGCCSLKKNGSKSNFVAYLNLMLGLILIIGSFFTK